MNSYYVKLQLRLGVRARAAREALEAGDPLPMVELHWPGTLLDDFQVDLIRSFFHGNLCEISVKGCTGAGKGCAVAIATNLWFTLYEQCKIIVTSASLDHARNGIFAEIAAWRRRMKYSAEGTILKSGFTAHEQKYLILANPDTGEGFSGHHGPHVLFIFDAATGAKDEFYNLAHTQANLVVALANPRTLSGWFRRGFPQHNPNRTQTIQSAMGLKRCITVSGRDCRNVREGRQIIPNQLSRERFNGIMAHSDPQFGRVYGLAEFPEEDAERQLILPSWLERHVNAEVQVDVEGFGLDVAASQYGDLTVLAAGGVGGVKALHTLQSADTMKIVAEVFQAAHSYGIDLNQGRHPIMIDAIGIGKGVCDRLREQQVTVREFQAAGTPDNPDQYRNRRAESYGELGQRLDPAGAWPDTPWRLPHDPLLLEELVAPERIYGSDGLKFSITPKDKRSNDPFQGDSLKQKLGRSPDRADAVTYLYDLVRRRCIRRGPPRITRPLITGDMFDNDPAPDDDDWDLDGFRQVPDLFDDRHRLVRRLFGR